MHNYFSLLMFRIFCLHHFQFTCLTLIAGNVKKLMSLKMDLKSLNLDLSELLESKNGCEYTDISDSVVDKIALNKDLNINILHLNVRSIIKNCDNLS